MCELTCLKFKKLRENAVLPNRKTSGAAGYDISLPTDFSHIKQNDLMGIGDYEVSYVCMPDGNKVPSFVIRCNNTVLIPLSFAVEIPEGYYGEIKPRSSLFLDGWTIEGIIDSDYRGEVKLMIRAPIKAPYHFNDRTVSLLAGERVAQMVIKKYESWEPVWVDELSDTERGDGGFGSTGV